MENSEWTIEERRILAEKIRKNLNKAEQIEIIKMIKLETNKYTVNNNGFFIDIVKLNNTLLNKMKDYLLLCENKTQNGSDEKIDKDEKIDGDEKIGNNENDKNIKVKIIKDNEDDTVLKNSYEDEDKDIDGSKISLKRLKPKYTGIKAKIIKNYKQTGSTNMINKTKKTKKEMNKVSENIYNIGETDYINDPDTIEDSDDNLENSDEIDGKCDKVAAEIIDI